ncbi:adenylate/guanylate cyclase domain-containing protein [Pikeienuella sp. HZG-20]|uniref:adenylate/guanylate cyclase domain-containing protein n=1 Tax=Paludibacillus litoralis TaxID=3133267 RepID=UPI0030EE2423
MTATTQPRRHGRISLKISLIAILIGTVALTSAAVHLPWLMVSRENVSDIAGQLNGEIIGGVNREVAALFSSAAAAQAALHDTLRDHVIDINDAASRERLFLAFLKANPHFSWVSFGAPNGDFFGAQRRGDDSLRLVESRWDPVRAEADRAETHVVEDEGRVSQTAIDRETNDYYAPGRAWYVKALQSPGRDIWTDIYIFSDSRKPGLNTAITLSAPGAGPLIGVISIAIELDQISNYLAELPTVRSGAAFLIDRRGGLIAFSDPGELVDQHPLSSDAALTPLSQSRHPMLRLAQTGLTANHVVFADVNERLQTTVTNAEGERFFLSLAPTAREGWLLGTLIPEADFMGAIYENYIRLILIVIGALIFVTVIALLVSRYLLVRPLQNLVAETRKIASFNLDDVRPVRSPLIEVAALSDAVEQMSRGLSSFRRYIPTDLVRMLLHQGVLAEIGGERRTLTIMFMDLQGFTSVSERLGHRIVPVLGEYFSAMSTAIKAHHGTIDKFIGDGVMAFWGAPKLDEDHPLQACRAALDCQAAMERLREDWAERGLPALKLRIGMTTGRVVVGNIGSPERLNYTVIGDPVNLAARLEGMNREFGTGVMISQHTYELVKYDMLARPLDTVRVKGREEPVAVYELLAPLDESGEAPGFEWAAHYENGFNLFAAGRLREASEAFRLAVELRGDDPVSRDFLARIEARLANDPAPRIHAIDREPPSAG